MTKEENFAIRMSVLLLSMRGEDCFCSELNTDDGREIPECYISMVLNDNKHCTAIKELIRLSVLESVTNNPRLYRTDFDGEFQYTAPNTYDHAYIVDTYIEQQYLKDNPLMAYRWVCEHCGSDNVQTKLWTRPNKNFELVHEDISEDHKDNYCNDCGFNINLIKKEMNVRSTVIGFQVDLDDNDEMHPDMSASFCIYSLPQVNQMINQDPNRWKLLAIYTDTIEEPTYMFNGDPREPDETVLETILKK